jgi:hypothetical protein
MDLLTLSYRMFLMYITLAIWIIGLFFLAFVVWKRKDFSQSTKITWAFFFVFMPLLAFLGYALFGRKKDIA